MSIVRYSLIAIGSLILFPANAVPGICIGEAVECATEDVSPSGFDLLVTFDRDSGELSEAARTNLKEFARALQDPALKDAKFTIDGHDNAPGSAEEAMTISRARAEAVRDYLIGLGVAPGRLKVRAFGRDHPRTDNPEDPINWRVEVMLRTD